MLTGADVLGFIGQLYILLGVVCVGLTALFTKGVKRKVGLSLLVFAIFCAWPVTSILVSKSRINDEVAKVEPARKRFEVLCKQAGEKVFRRVDDVEGVLLLNIRQGGSSDWSDKNWIDAGLPFERAGDEYIRTFLYWEHHDDQRVHRGFLNGHLSQLPGYKYVDTRELGGAVLRYRLIKDGTAKLSQEVVSGQSARYAISFVNHLDPNDRSQWIAGTTVSIVDTQSNELLAQSTWFSFESGQGSLTGNRVPWAFSETCPTFIGTRGSSTRFFVDQVLKPKREVSNVK